MKSKKKILVADDEEPIRIFLKRALEKEGYEVLLASGGEEAVQMCTAHVPDLVLLDLYMPDVNGLDVLMRIRQAHSSVPVVMLTGNQNDTLALAAMKLGAYDYLTKPVEISRLQLTIKAKLL